MRLVLSFGAVRKLVCGLVATILGPNLPLAPVSEILKATPCVASEPQHILVVRECRPHIFNCMDKFWISILVTYSNIYI